MLTAFTASNFDVNAWANETCTNMPEGESLEKYLAELEMRLHLLAEELDAAIEDESARALQHIPNAVQELAHVKADASSLQADVQKSLQGLAKSAEEAEKDVAALAALDLAKVRMEEACTTLKEATELAGLFQKVEPVFASGNLQRVAALLATMRRGLQVVGDIPEFEGGQQKLQALEERFKSLLEPQLSSAFAARDGEAVQQLSELLDAVGESSAVNRMYTTSAASALQKVWSALETEQREGQIWTWLPALHERLITTTASEVKWTLQNLPDHYPAIIISLIQNFFLSHQAALTQQMSDDVQQVSSQAALDHLGKLVAHYTDFLLEIRARLSSALPEDLTELWAAIYAPLDKQLTTRYATLEQQQLSKELADAMDVGESDKSSQAVVESLDTAIEKAVKSVQTAAQRCVRITQSTELDAFIGVADQALHTFARNLQAIADGLGKDLLKEMSGAATQSTMEVPTLLPLLSVAERLKNQIAMLDARLRGVISDLREDFNKDFGGPESLSYAYIQVHSSKGALSRRLGALTSSLEDTRFSTLPAAASGAKDFSSAVQGIVFDMLMHKLRTELDGMALLPVWSASEPESKYNLPSFSAYPQSQVTASGEYLMMLPQMLEALIDSSEAPDSTETGLDGDWLDKIANGAAELLTRELRGIKSLSQHGSAQLAADLEYFCNVLHALGIAAPTELGTWQVMSQWTDEDFPGALADALQDNILDKATVQRVTAVRQLKTRASQLS